MYPKLASNGESQINMMPRYRLRREFSTELDSQAASPVPLKFWEILRIINMRNASANEAELGNDCQDHKQSSVGSKLPIMDQDNKPEEREETPVRKGEKLKFGIAANRVMYGDVWICTCKSHTMAKRIANLLNRYPANEKGE